MKRHRSSLSIVLALLSVSLAAHAQVRPADAADPAMLNRIWLEGTNNSRVMEHLSWITDVFGPQIPGSPAYDKAAEWAVRRFTEFGLANAASAVAMEAVRILKALGVKPRRTIRAAFWTGEEEGFFGSRGYVARHFGDTDKQSLAKMDFETLDKSWRNPLGDSRKLLAKPEYAKISGYFNYDNGSGRIRGVYLQENFAVRPIFEEWMKPLKDLGVTAIALQNTEGTDHLPFDYIGIPGLQFIQDPLDYFPWLHHTNQDVYDHAVPEDLIQSAVVMAYFVYQTAMREDMLPRKPLPIPVEMPVKGK